jgi:hypothetical protein
MITRRASIAWLLVAACGDYVTRNPPVGGPRYDIGTGTELVVADFDGDDDLDIATTTGSEIFILVNSTEAGADFASFASSIASHDEVSRISAVELDGEPGADLWARRRAFEWCAYDNTTTVVDQPTIEVRGCVGGGVAGTLGSVLGDIDGDGKMDRAWSTTRTCHVSLNRTDVPGLDWVRGPDFGHRDVHAIHDLDGDGRGDLVLNALGVMLSKTSPSDAAAQFDPIVELGGYGHHLEIVDLDGDAKPDIVRRDGTTLIIRFNTSTVGTLAVTEEVTFDLGVDATTVTFADVDTDGRMDVLVPDAQTLAIRLNTAPMGSQTFTLADPIVPPLSSPFTVLDTNSDGVNELFVSNESAIELPTSWHPLVLQREVIDDLPAGSRVIPADIDRDGRMDLVAHYGSQISVFLANR